MVSFKSSSGPPLSKEKNHEEDGLFLSPLLCTREEDPGGLAPRGGGICLVWRWEIALGTGKKVRPALSHPAEGTRVRGPTQPPIPFSTEEKEIVYSCSCPGQLRRLRHGHCSGWMTRASRATPFFIRIIIPPAPSYFKRGNKSNSPCHHTKDFGVVAFPLLF